MRKLLYIFLILLGFTSCMREDRVKVLPNAKDKVDIFFDVSLPEPTYGTKAMGDTPEVESLWVAVFGSSGFLKEFVQAEVDEDQLATTNYNETTPQKYKYKVTLSLTDSDVKIHFIANPPTGVLPFRNEDEVMSTLMTSGNQDAYWQRKVIEGGIRAYKDEDGNFLDKNGNIINIDQGDSPVIDPDVEAQFGDIPLIRNFAKIVVTVRQGAGFTLKKYAVINKPKSGSVAPYNSGTSSFVENYQSKSYSDLLSSYPGNLPLNAEIDKTIPEDENDPAFSADPIYIYERPIPTQDPTTIIIWGTYSGDNKDYFYKVDLMDTKGYYAIYRNFRYKIEIQDVVRAGFDTPEKAANSSGSGDISADVNAQNLTDVSDGTARILVSYTDTTIVGQNFVELRYQFIPNVSTGTVNNDAVTITNKDDTPISVPGEVIGSDWNTNYANSDGWRTLRFKTTTPGNVMKSQDIKVVGSYNGGASKLYRIVSFHLMSTQDLEVVCVPHEVPRTKGEKVDVLIKLPKDLPRSLFPLQLKIEADKKSLTPDGDNLPVNPGTTITGGTSASYQFIKTLSEDEYKALQDTASTGKVIVTCHFKTTRDASAGLNDTDECIVYAVDKDEAYFNTANGSFTNFDLKHFRYTKFDRNDASAQNANVTLSFLMDGPYLPEVKIKLKGLIPDDNRLNPVSGEDHTYTFNPDGVNNVSISLLTEFDGGVYGASLSAHHYLDTSIANLNYQEVKFITSQVPFGKNKDMQFQFKYEGTEDDPITEEVVFELINLKPADSQTAGTFTPSRDGRWIYRPTQNIKTHTLTFKTEKFAADVSVSMSGASYNPAGPFSLVAPTSLTIAERALTFTGNNNPASWNNQYTVRVYNSSGTEVGSFNTGYGSYGYNYNWSSFTIDLSKFNDSEDVYFQFTRNNNTYRSGTYTLTQLVAATSSSQQPITGWNRVNN